MSPQCPQSFRWICRMFFAFLELSEKFLRRSQVWESTSIWGYLWVFGRDGIVSELHKMVPSVPKDVPVILDKVSSERFLQYLKRFQEIQMFCMIRRSHWSINDNDRILPYILETMESFGFVLSPRVFWSAPADSCGCSAWKSLSVVTIIDDAPQKSFRVQIFQGTHFQESCEVAGGTTSTSGRGLTVSEGTSGTSDRFQ